jgi:biopolymer transport protein ExbD
MVHERNAQLRGAARRESTHGRTRLALSITPMIDVVFQLLIYFLLTAGLMSNERILRGELPPESPASRTNDPFALEVEPLVIRVASLGESLQISLSIDVPNPTNLEALEQFLRDAMLNPTQPQGLFPPDHPIRIAPDPRTRWEHVVGVFNAAVTSGYTSIAFGGRE